MKIFYSARDSFVSLLDQKALAEALHDSTGLLLGVSGGADSVAMLRAVHETGLAPQLSCIHVNHGLRPEADAEEQFVRRLCAQLGVHCHVRRLTGAGDVRGGSAEAHWRQLRYEAFSSVLNESGSHLLALGHTADDLAETFLFHLVRGTGVDGLRFQFQSETNGLRIVRPLWKTRRSGIERVLRHNNQAWVEDPSNTDRSRSRNLIRHDIMPLLQRINPDAVGAIARASEIIGENASRAERTGYQQTDAGVMLRFHEIRGKGDAVVAECLRNFVSAHGLNLDRRQTAQAVQMVAGGKVGTVALTGASTLVITQDFAWVCDAQEPTDRQLAEAHVSRYGGLYGCVNDQLAATGSTGGHHSFQVATLSGKPAAVKITGADGTLALRNRRRGERVGNTPLKKLLNEYRVPWYLRDYLMFVVRTADDIIVGGISHDERFCSAIARHAGCPRLDIVVNTGTEASGG